MKSWDPLAQDNNNTHTLLNPKYPSRFECQYYNLPKTRAHGMVTMNTGFLCRFYTFQVLVPVGIYYYNIMIYD